MPSPIAHAAAGYAFYRMVGGGQRRHVTSGDRLLWTAATVCSLLPDIDLVAAVLLPAGRSLHGTATHSLVAVLLAAATAAGIARISGCRHVWRWWLLGGACYLAHLAMDALTLGRGVMLLWPLSATRFVSPVKLFYGLHWSEGLLSWSHIVTLATELGFAVVVLAAVGLASRKARCIWSWSTERDRV